MPVPTDVTGVWPHNRKPDAHWVYRNEAGERLFVVARFDQADGKKIMPISYCETATDARRAWQYKAPPEPRPLYGLDRLAANPEKPVLLVEGEKTAEAARVMFADYVAITWQGGAAADGKADWQPLSGRKAILWPDADEPGRAAMARIAETLASLGCTVRLVDVPKDWPQGWDLADTLPDGVTVDDLATLLAPAAPLVTAPDVERLAALDPLAYDTCRKDEAQRMGVRVATLDAEVKSCRAKNAESKPGIVDDIEPWPLPVDSAGLLNQIEGMFSRYIVCEPEVRIAATLWVAFTWFIDCVNVAPLAIITAPEKRCGKTQMLDLISKLCRRPMPASSISPAALYRVVERDSPTLLIDEADAFLKTNDELRGIINSGHTRTSAYVIRCIGDDQDPKRFSTWGAKVLCGIGTLPETLTDRAVVLELRRKLQTEHIERLRYADNAAFVALARKLARLAQDHAGTIQAARPALPKALNDRAQDNWEPLLAIAELVGGAWPERARQAALALSGQQAEPISRGVELLSHCRDAFECEGTSRLAMNALLRRLNADDEAPWATYNRGLPLRPRQLGKMLGEYGITSKTLRFSSGTSKGYERAQFEDAWSRYLSAPTPSWPATQLQISEINDLGVTEALPSYSPLPARSYTEYAGNTLVTHKTLKTQQCYSATGEEGWEAEV